MSRSLIRRGTCHVLGDDVSLDDGIIPARFAAQRVTDPAQLVPHLFETVDPGFAARANPGDIVLTGRGFARGKPRMQGFIAMAAMDLSVVCTSMPYKMLRRAVARAIPVAVGAEIGDFAQTGDEVEVDFGSGLMRNLSRGGELPIPPMPPILGDIVATGGMEALLHDWLARHPEQALDAQT